MGGSPDRSVTAVGAGPPLLQPARLRVAWVDDDEYVRGYAATYLPSRGMEVQVAANGIEGL